MHSSFRTSSTYLWSHFRKSPRVVAYYEILHEIMAMLRREQLTSLDPGLWPSHHPAGAPYFLEYAPLLREAGGVDGFDPAMSYAHFIPAEGCGGALSGGEAAFAARLIAHAEQRGRIPVLTATRSLGRLRGFKAALPGQHLMLYRNVFQQWCSVTDQAAGGNSYFFDRMLEVVRLNGHDPVLHEIQQVFPMTAPSVEDPHSFYTFVLLHLHLYCQAAGAADLIVDINRLQSDAGHREAVETHLAGQDIALRLDDVRNVIAFSLCRLAPGADAAGRLRAMGEAVIDRAPDAAGRAFGAKVLGEMLEEHERHEFQAGALRRFFLGRGESLVDRRAVEARATAAEAARDAALGEAAGLNAAVAAAQGTCLAVSGERDAARAEAEALRLALGSAMAREAAALAGQEALRAAVAAAGAERAGLVGEHAAALEGLRDAGAAQRAVLAAELEALQLEFAACRGERDAGLAERDALRAAHSELGVRYAVLRAQAAADRASLLGSVSWRVSWPLRGLGFDRAVQERVVS